MMTKIQFCGAVFPLGDRDADDPLDVYVRVGARYCTVQWRSINGAAPTWNINPNAQVRNLGNFYLDVDLVYAWLTDERVEAIREFAALPYTTRDLFIKAWLLEP